MSSARSSSVWTGGIRLAPPGNAEHDMDAPSGQWRWFVGSVVLFPVLLMAGVYWLHRSPTGPTARDGSSVIHVELVPTPSPATEVKQASLQANPPIADFQADPRISEQSEAPVEHQVVPPQPMMRPQPTFAPDRKPAGGGQSKAVPAGTASRFQRQLHAHIERYLRYRGASGTVLVMFAMRRDGSVVRIGVKSSSGRPLLDQEALETIRRAQPLPRIPADMPDQITVLLPMAFDAQ